ncbi:DUF1173 family protein [Ochrobactrum quorumnocens]|nr:DUF1173 family protein [[Ochrobactrum] quorumnocens]
MKPPSPEPRYRMGATILASRIAESGVSDKGNGAWAQTIRSAAAKGQRPNCLCTFPNPPMYLCRFDDRYVIKRMPGTGFLHAAGCLHYQPRPKPLFNAHPTPSAPSRGTNETGNLKLTFDLSKRPPRCLVPATSSLTDPTTARLSTLPGLSLIALLQLLWQSADLHHWHPAFEGKRHWWTVRNRLHDAAARFRVKAQPLLDRLYIPEAFSHAQKQAIASRQKAFLQPFRAQRQVGRELIVMIAEIKDITPARYGFRLFCKHAPQLAVFINQNLLNRLKRHHASAFALHQAHPHTHLMMIATAGITLQDAVCIEQCALMLVTQHWLPCASEPEVRLLEGLVQQGRLFVKKLDSDCRDRQTPTVLLTDTRPPTALFITETALNPARRQALADTAHQSGFAWRTFSPVETIWPELPPLEPGHDTG